MKEISIIIPTYNSELTVEKTVLSILNQDGPSNYEIICVDDGSTDGTWDKLRNLTTENSEVSCYRQTNQKQAAARNNGLTHATGKYIMFADADDYWLPGMLEAVVRNLGSELTILGIKKDYSAKMVVETRSGMAGSKTRQDLITNYLTNNLEMDVGVWNKVFSKVIIDEYHLHFSNGNFFEDSLFVMKYLVHVNPNNIVYEEMPYYVLNKHENTTTSQFSPDIIPRAEKYISEVTTILSRQSLTTHQQQLIIAGLNCRLALHISHHYMLHAPSWSTEWQREFLRTKLTDRQILKNGTIPKKYKIAWLVLVHFPKVYRKLYVTKKPQI